MKLYTVRYIDVENLYGIMEAAKDIVRRYGFISKSDIIDLYNGYLFGYDHIENTYKNNMVGFTKLDNMKLVIYDNDSYMPDKLVNVDAKCYIQFPWNELTTL